MRTAGSHGFADIVAVKHNEPVNFVQCKRTESKSEAKRLADRFKDAPPYPKNEHFNQWLYIKVKGTPAHDFLKVLV